MTAELKKGPVFRPPPGSVMDDRLLMREFYNCNPFPITFLRDNSKIEYIQLSDKPVGPQKIVCNPDQHILLMHGFYQATWPDFDRRPPEEVLVHLNFGKEMNRGIKPNREVQRKARRYVR